MSYVNTPTTGKMKTPTWLDGLPAEDPGLYAVSGELGDTPV
jgi:hypothetical protein